MREAFGIPQRFGLGLAVCGVAVFLAAQPAQALSLAECTRTTHISHGGEAQHRDMGAGRVMWLDWWSQEGTAKTLVLSDCAGGETLRLRTQEENMGTRLPFDRTDKALKAIEEAHQADRVFATLPRVAEAVDKNARDAELSRTTHEFCACAALYADLRGDKTPFVLAKSTAVLKTKKDQE